MLTIDAADALTIQLKYITKFKPTPAKLRESD